MYTAPTTSYMYSKTFALHMHMHEILSPYSLLDFTERSLDLYKVKYSTPYRSCTCIYMYIARPVFIQG